VAYNKTELGNEVLKTRALPLSPKQRAMLIMADGTKDGAQLLALTAGMGSMVEDLTDLVVKGLIVNVAGGAPQQAAVRPVATPVPAPVAPPVMPAVPQPHQEVDVQSAAPRHADYKTAYQAGVALTSGLGFKGFRLNMSMESASDVGAIRELRPKILEAMISKHGESKARDLMRDFDRALGLR
jgi:hypothetical protein